MLDVMIYIYIYIHIYIYIYIYIYVYMLDARCYEGLEGRGAVVPRRLQRRPGVHGGGPHLQG